MTGITDDPPWLSLPTEIGVVLAECVPHVVRQVIATIPRTVPTYARPMEGTFGDGVRRGTQVALDRFVTLPGTRRSALSPLDWHVYADLGRGEVRNGRSLEALLAAYRVGARVTLREMSRITVENRYDTGVLVALGESVLAYIEELSSASAQGYAEEQSERAGELDRRRVDVLDLLLSGLADETAAQQAAVAAAWVLPARLSAVTLPAERADGLRVRLGREALVRVEPTEAVVLVPAPRGDAERRDLEGRLRDRRAVVGPSRGWPRVADSLRLARLGAAALTRDPDQPDAPVWVEDRLVELLLASEPRIVTQLGAARLAPLAALRRPQRERLELTLLSWLRHWGQRGPIAAELHVHPQTVGYRVGQLRRVFGADLDDPQARFELEVALRSRLTATATSASGGDSR